MEGIVVRSTGRYYEIDTKEGERVQASISAKFRIQGLKLTNPVAVGDKVILTIDEQSKSYFISQIIPRKNYIVRQSPRKKHYHHLIASNVDQVFLFVTITQPNIKPGFIDRFLLTTNTYEIPTYLIFNKADIYKEKHLDMYAAISEIYEKVGYKTFLASSIDPDSVQQLRTMLAGKTTLISGHSGVGKSTFLNAVQDGLSLKTNPLSNYTGKGQHTTTYAEMFTLKEGGYIIDTPGIKTLSYLNMEPLDVAQNFKELYEYSSGCKYNNCLHQNEPQCAVKDAIEDGHISELRYLNYLQILEDTQDQNYWERNNDL